MAAVVAFLGAGIGLGIAGLNLFLSGAAILVSFFLLGLLCLQVALGFVALRLRGEWKKEDGAGMLAMRKMPDLLYASVPVGSKD